MKNCVFCRVIAGEIPSQFLHEDDKVVAFRDIRPLAPVHVLVVPRQHIPAVNDLSEGHAALIGHMALVARDLARREGVADKGYRLSVNNGPDAGQEVDHLHLHLIGGHHLGRIG